MLVFVVFPLQLYHSPFADTSYVILQRDSMGTVTYPLMMGQTYQVDVCVVAIVIIIIGHTYSKFNEYVSMGLQSSNNSDESRILPSVFFLLCTIL